MEATADRDTRLINLSASVNDNPVYLITLVFDIHSRPWGVYETVSVVEEYARAILFVHTVFYRDIE